MFVEIFDVRLTSQKPKQLVNDRFDVQLFRRQERKSRAARPQIEARLRTKDRQRSGAGAIIARLTFFQNEPEKIVILPHALNVEAGVSPASFDVAAAVLGCFERFVPASRESIFTLPVATT